MADPANSVAVATGSLVVTGTLTSFVAAEYDLFILDGDVAAIASRDSATQITLKQPWAGDTASGVTAWTIANTGPYWQSTVAVNKQLAELLSKFEAGPVKWDASGPLSGRGAYDGQATDFVYLSLDPMPFTLFVKLSSAIGDWSAGQVIAQKADSTADAEAARDLAQQAASTASSKADVAVGAAGTAQTSAAATSADRAQTGQDRTATGSNASTTSADRTQTGQDRSQTGADRAATAADRAQTGQDRSTTTANAGATSADRAQTGADRAQTGSDAAATILARTQAQNAVASGRVSYDTLAQLQANLAPADGAQGEVLNDGANNGLYTKAGAPGAGSWARKSTATVTGLDVLTAFVRQVLFATDSGAFTLSDLAGNVGMRFDGVNGLQAALAQFSKLSATQASATQISIPGSLTLSTNPADGSLVVTDAEGKIGLRLDDKAMTVCNLVVAGLLTLSGGVSSKAYSFGGCTLTTCPDPNLAFAITDANGWILLALTMAGKLIVPSLQTNALGSGGDYSADYIAERSARAVALSAGYRGLTDTTSAAAIWAYNHALWYGQSLCAAQEGSPGKTQNGRSDVLMIGQSTRPGGSVQSTTPSPLGDSVLRPAVATVQVQGTGALIDAAGQAALAAGNDALGEDPGLGAMLFARLMFLQRLGVQAADDRRFVTTNVGVPGRAIEELSKGAPTEFFNRLRAMASAVKGAANAAGGSYGIPALFWLQGEWNYSGTNGGSTDKATYKANLLKLYNDFVADVCVGIAGQVEKPAIITYQTGGQYTVDTTDMSIGMAQWELSQENPSWYLAAPSYPVTDKNGHLDPNGYRWLGCQMGKVFHETVVMRRRWKPTSPLQATWRGQTVLVDFHLPSGTSLQFQPVYVGSTAVSYADKGFTVIDASGTVPLASVTLAGDAVVQIVALRPLVAPVNVYYGRQTTFAGGGNLCDSDPTVAPFNYEYTAGSGDYAAANIAALVGKPYPLWNWCVSFKMTATAN